MSNTVPIQINGDKKFMQLANAVTFYSENVQNSWKNQTLAE